MLFIILINFKNVSILQKKAKLVECHWTRHFLRNLLRFFLINTLHFRNITEMPCHAMSSVSTFQSEPCHLPCPASKNSRCFWRVAVFAALARWGVKTGAGVMERVPISPLGEGWNPEWLHTLQWLSRPPRAGGDEQMAGSESPNWRFKHRRFDLSANQGHVECLFISLTNVHIIFGDWCGYE